MVTPNSPTGWAVTLDRPFSAKRPKDLPDDWVSSLPSLPRKVRFQGEPLTTFAVNPPDVSEMLAPSWPTSPSPSPSAAVRT